MNILRAPIVGGLILPLALAMGGCVTAADQPVCSDSMSFQISPTAGISYSHTTTYYGPNGQTPPAPGSNSGTTQGTTTGTKQGQTQGSTTNQQHATGTVTPDSVHFNGTALCDNGQYYTGSANVTDMMVVPINEYHLGQY